MHNFIKLIFPGKPPMCSAWICQCILYAALATFAKSLLALVLQQPLIVAVLSTLRISPVSDPKLEVAVVMLIIPFFVNVSIWHISRLIVSIEIYKLMYSLVILQVLFTVFIVSQFWNDLLLVFNVTSMIVQNLKKKFFLSKFLFLPKYFIAFYSCLLKT